MDMDTIDAVGDVITRYATTRDASKVDLHLAPQNNFSPYIEDDHHSTSAESTEDEGHDDYETPISAPDSRRASTDEMRESSENIQKTESPTSQTESPINAPSDVSSSPLPPKTKVYPATAPPAYKAGADDISAFNFRQFKGPKPLPMAEPGTEPLPEYKANIELSNVFLRKSEFHTLSQRCPDRKWRRVIATLTGTKLEIHSATRPLLSHAMPNHNDETTNFKKGALMKSYGLQHAEFGLASDYLKRKHVIRVRVEAEQFLLSCSRIETLVSWMEGLQWGAGVALELDERLEVKEQTLPRSLRRRRRRREETTMESVARRGEAIEVPDEEEDSGAAGEDRLREGRRAEIFRSPSPTIEEETAPDPEPTSNHGGLINNHLFTASAYSSIASTPNISRANSVRRPPNADAPAPAGMNHTRAAASMTISFRPALRQALSPERPQTSSGGQNGRNGLARYPSALSQSTMSLAPPSGPSSMVNTPNTSSLNLSSRRARRKAAKSTTTLLSIEKEVWNPAVSWSSTYDLAYAKKCMPVMHRFARRKSTFVIYQGERVLVCASKVNDKEGRAIPMMVKLERGLPECKEEGGFRLI